MRREGPHLRQHNHVDNPHSGVGQQCQYCDHSENPPDSTVAAGACGRVVPQQDSHYAGGRRGGERVCDAIQKSLYQQALSRSGVGEQPGGQLGVMPGQGGAGGEREPGEGSDDEAVQGLSSLGMPEPDDDGMIEAVLLFQRPLVALRFDPSNRPARFAAPVIELRRLGRAGALRGMFADLRRDDPYLAYGALRELITVPVRTGGDARDRYAVLAEQLPVSIALAEAVLGRLDALGEGPVDVPLPKVVRLPEGTTYAAVEGPLGISGVLLVGAGDKHPWRMKVRSASFATMQAMPAAPVGTPLTRLADAVMSMPVILGDVDR